MSLRQELGVEFLEESLERAWSALGKGVDTLDELVDTRGHDEKIAGWFGARVPVGVGSAAGDENGRAGAGFDHSIANLDAQNAFEDVPGFIVVVMEMAWSDIAWRSWRSTGIAPFGDDKVIRGRTDDISGEGRSDRARVHGGTR